jgi:hypothetical protein
MTFCVASQLVFIVVSEYFFIGSVRKLLDTTSYIILVYLRFSYDCRHSLYTAIALRKVVSSYKQISKFNVNVFV